MSGPMVNVQYDCKECGIKDRVVPVRERLAIEDVMSWMTTVQRELGVDHMKTSPHCTSRLYDLKIPLVGKDNCRIGEARRQ